EDAGGIETLRGDDEHVAGEVRDQGLAGGRVIYRRGEGGGGHGVGGVAEVQVLGGGQVAGGVVDDLVEDVVEVGDLAELDHAHDEQEQDRQPERRFQDRIAALAPHWWRTTFPGPLKPPTGQEPPAYRVSNQPCWTGAGLPM